MARHRNQIKPDALKVTNAAKCESQADVHERLGSCLISGAFKENVTLPSLLNIIDNVILHLNCGQWRDANIHGNDLWKIIMHEYHMPNKEEEIKELLIHTYF